MKSFVVCVLILTLVGVAGAEPFTSTLSDVSRAVTFNSFISSHPKNTCFNFSLGDNKFSVCGIDNASKIMVDDCETIGFVHAWKVEETMVQAGPDWSMGPNGGVVINSPGYTVKKTRRCLNCTVVEEEYNEVTPKWRRK